MASSVRSPFLIFVTGYLLFVLFAWFVVNLIIEAEPQEDEFNTFDVQFTLAEQSLQLWMYSALLCLFALSASWFADMDRTKGGRAVAAMVCTFSKSIWLFELWYIISTYYSSNNQLNWYCGGGNVFPNTPSSSSDWCNLAQAAATLSILVGLGLISLWIFGLVNRFMRIVPEVPIPTHRTLLPSQTARTTNADQAAHNDQISWRTMLTHPDDIEQAFISAAYPQLFGKTRSRLNFLSKLGTACLVFISIGVLLMTYPSIVFSKNQGLNAWPTASYTQTVGNDYNGWGDPQLASNWYWLMLTLGVAVAAAGYADGRSHRSWTAFACTVCTVSALQFWSFWIYSARRLHASYSSLVNTGILNNTNSQYAEIAGAGLVMLSLTALAFILFIRYFVFLRITVEQHRAFHQGAHLDAPTEVRVHHNGEPTEMYLPGPQHGPDATNPNSLSYNMSVWNGVTMMMRLLCVIEVLVMLAWWIMQIVSESEGSLFDGLTENQAFFFNERMFLLCSVLGLSSFLPTLYSERHRLSATAVASFLNSFLILAAFFILVWPWAFQSIHNGGVLYDSACPDNTFCQLTQASAIFAVIQGFMLAVVALHNTVRSLMWMGWEADPSKRLSSHPSTLLASLMVITIWVWAIVTIRVTTTDDKLGFFQQWQRVVTSTVIQQNDEGASFTENYWASQAFLVLVIFTLSIWTAVFTGGLNPQWQSRAWRTVTMATLLILCGALLPMFIFACRFARDLSLNGSEATFVAVFIILPLLAVAKLAIAAVRCAEPLFEQDTQMTDLSTQKTILPPLPPRPAAVTVDPTTGAEVQHQAVPAIHTTMPMPV